MRATFTVLCLLGATPALGQRLDRRLEARRAEPWQSIAPWVTDYDQAKRQARRQGKVILAYFTAAFEH